MIVTELAGNSMVIPDATAVFYALMLAMDKEDIFSNRVPDCHQAVESLSGRGDLNLEVNAADGDLRHHMFGLNSSAGYGESGDDVMGEESSSSSSD